MATNPGTNPNPNPGTNPFEGVNIEELAARLGGYNSEIGKIAEEARKALAGLPTLNIIEKRKVKINGQDASAALLQHGGILLEFPSAEAAAEHFKNQYP